MYTFAKSLARDGPNYKITKMPPINEYKRKEAQAFSHFLSFNSRSIERKLVENWFQNWFESILPPLTPTFGRDNFLSRAPIDARFAATRSCRHPLHDHYTCKAW
ncbi:hypothetical protein PIB30_098610, partial [Stylosanthes scabra]|nr:hypothetical protein [Stylosanthes scabra]